MTKFKKTMLASGMAAALTGVSLPSQAIIEGAAGEALLVPFVLFDSVTSINTLIEVTVPSSVGLDTVPNFFTAPNTTPTNVNPVGITPDPDLGPAWPAAGNYSTAGLHVYFFNERSEEKFNTRVPTSPDDFMLINWGDFVLRQKPALDGQKGYIVITNDKGNGNWNDAADFSMFGDAYMVFPLGFGFIDTKIPVLPMSDGADTIGAPPTVRNNVVHKPNSVGIQAVSPLSSGMRTNTSNGALQEFTLFDLTMSNRFAPTLHVIWVDRNLGQDASVLVFNDEEEWCSDGVPIDNELNVYWTSTGGWTPGPNLLNLAPAWVDVAYEFCYPDSVIDVVDFLNSDILYPGFAVFQLNEYVDTNINQPESAAVAFSIQLQVDVIDEEHAGPVFVPQLLPVETALAHERGQFGTP